MKVKNVIIINDYAYVEGGAAKVAIDTANILVSNGYNVLFLTTSKKVSEELDNKIIIKSTNQDDFLSYKSKINGLLSGLKNKKFYKLVNEELKKYNNEDTIVHVHGWTKGCSAFFFKAIKQKKFKCVVTLHEYFSICPNGGLFNYRTSKACTLKPFGAKCKLCNCDSRNYFFKLYRVLRHYYYRKYMYKGLKYICVSNFQANILNKYSKKEYMILENPLVACKQSIKTNLEKKYDFVYIGRTSKEKGIDLFMHLVNEMKNCEFLLIGDFKNKFPSNLTVTGWVSEEKVSEMMLLARCLVLPSIWPEPFGLNAYKAINNGVLALVSNNTAASKLVKNGYNGYTFEQNNFSDLVEKAKKVLQINTSNNHIMDCPNSFFYNYSEYLDKVVGD